MPGSLDNECGWSRVQTLILAGGEGERLFPLTLSRPKPALPFGGSFRIVDFTLSNCVHSGLKDVTLLTQYRHHDLYSYIRRGWSTPACLPPAPGRRYRGTADAVFQNLSIMDSKCPDYVLILSGDHVYNMDYRDLIAQHVATDADVTISAVEHPLRDASHFGVLEVDDRFRVKGFEEKPKNPRPLVSRPDRAFISMGIYLFKREVLIERLIETCGRHEGYDFGHHVIPSMIESSRVFAFDFRDEVLDTPRYWRDIGTIDSYYEASMDLTGPASILNSCLHHPMPSRSRWIRPRVQSNSHISRSVLSPGVCVEEGACVADSVLMPGARIGRGAVVRRAIIEEGVYVPAGSRIGADTEEDRKRYAVSASGVVVAGMPAEGTRFGRLMCHPKRILRSHRDAGGMVINGAALRSSA